MSCQLCGLVEGNFVTKVHYIGPDFVIVDCKTCGIPQVVYKIHGKEPSPELKQEMLKIAKHLFGEKARFRGYSRSIPKEVHWHEHILVK